MTLTNNTGPALHANAAELASGTPDATVYLPLVAKSQPVLPLRAAFYYPWFPEAWEQHGIYPYTHYTPTLGFYDSTAQVVIQQHIAAMQYGNIQAGIVSWWGPGTRSDDRLPAILSATLGSAFWWSVYHEGEAQSDPTVSEIASDLTYLRDRYGSDPGYLRINGRFVVFVYGDTADGCGMAERWQQANATIQAFIVLKVFPGYESCTGQPDGWHQYSPSKAADSQGDFSYSISPGFWKVGENPRLSRDLTRWRQNVRDMVASGAAFQLVTTFNEWGEGTAVESASDWASSSGYGAYLDALHDNGVDTLPLTPTSHQNSTLTNGSSLIMSPITETLSPRAFLPIILTAPAPVLVGAGDTPTATRRRRGYGCVA
jgi:hypothetical protein